MSTWNHSPATGRPYLHGTNGGTTMNNNYTIQQPLLHAPYQQPSFRGMPSFLSNGIGNHHRVHPAQSSNVSHQRCRFVDGVRIVDMPGSHGYSISFNYGTNVRNTRTHPEHHNTLRLRALPEDGVALLENPGSSYLRNSIRQPTNNQQLDIDDMSYEEVLLLQERIGVVRTGMLEEKISSCLKTRIHLASTYSSHLNESTAENETCIICQAEYEMREKIGTLNCGHEYHVNCIKQWLMLNNICPICRRPALTQ